MKNIRKSSALKISRIFKSEVKKQIEINRLIKVSNVSALQLPVGANARSNKNIINYFNMLKYYLKGLQIYSNFLNTYVSSWNNKSLIIKNNKNTLEGGLSSACANITKATYSANASIQSTNVSATSTISSSTRILSNKFINKYLKSITKFNLVPATGSNTRPRRLNLFNYSQQINYNFNRLNNILIKKICNLLFNSFFSMNCIISKPIFEFKNDKIVIHLFFYLFKKELLTIEARKNKTSSSTLLSLNKNKISILCTVLSQLFNKEVVLELNRIYYPYFDSNIFVNLLAQIINKIKLRRITKRFFLKAKMKNPFKQLNTRGESGQALVNAKLPSLLSGLHIKISGRLLTNRIIPKKTTSIISRGALAKMKVNYLDIARYTNKNKRGAFTITITSGQNLT